MNVVGEKVALGPLHGGLLPLLARWENDWATVALAGDEPGPRSPEAIEAAWGPLIRGERPGWTGFALYEAAGRRPVGHANLRDHGSVHRTAEFGIFIGEADWRGRGLGTEATRLVLGYAFGVLDLHNVWLDTRASNGRAIRAYEKAGFRTIGRRREAHRAGELVEDVVLMDCLATEFRRPG